MWELRDTFTDALIARCRPFPYTMLVDGSDRLYGLMDGVFFEDQNNEGVPSSPGFYTCTVEVWFQQGYSEGYKDDRESEIEFRIRDVRPVPAGYISTETAMPKQDQEIVIIVDRTDFPSGPLPDEELIITEPAFDTYIGDFFGRVTHWFPLPPRPGT